MVRYANAMIVLLALSWQDENAVLGFVPRRRCHVSDIGRKEAIGGESRRRSSSSVTTREVAASTPYEYSDDGPSRQTEDVANESGAYVASLANAMGAEDDLEEEQINIKKQLIRDRRRTPYSYEVTLPLNQALGISLCQVAPGMEVSDMELNLDTLDLQKVTAADDSVEVLNESKMLDKLGPRFRGVLVASVAKNSYGWNAGVRPGDVVISTSATIGNTMWPKTNLDGVRSAIISRSAVAGTIDFQLQRIRDNTANVANQFELTLSRPLGLEIQEKEDGYVEVTGFNENASRLVQYAVQVGDRILAVESSFGSQMWPVSSVEGVISACTGRIPGKPVTIRFERPLVEEKVGVATTKAPPILEKPTTREAVISQEVDRPINPFRVRTVPANAENEALLSRCRKVFQRYLSQDDDEILQKLAEKGIPSLVADKVFDAIAEASGSFDALTLSMAMNAYITCKKPEAAIRAFEAATGVCGDGSTDEVAQPRPEGCKESGVLVPAVDALNLYTASSLMKAQAMLGDNAAVKRILTALEGKTDEAIAGKTPASWPGAGKGGSLFPDTHCYNVVLSTGAQRGKALLDKLELFESMGDPRKPGTLAPKNIVTYNTMIDALTSAGRHDDAFVVFYDMKKVGIRPDKYTYTTLVKACSTVDEMQEMLYDMKEKGVKATVVTYNAMVKNLCNQLKWYDAKKIIVVMEANGVKPDAMTYGFLMSGLVKARKPSAALTLFESACSDPRTVSLTENVHLYTTAIAASSVLGDYERAFELMSRMNKAGVMPDVKTSTALMGACMASNEGRLAYDVYKRIQNPDGFAHAKAVQALAMTGEFSQALELFGSKLEEMSGKQAVMAFGRLIDASLREWDFEFARQALRVSMERSFYPSKKILRFIIRAMEIDVTQGQWSESSEESFDFLIFILDLLQEKSLKCDSAFYQSLLNCGAQIGGGRRKLCSLMSRARIETGSAARDLVDVTGTRNVDDKPSPISWGDLLKDLNDGKKHEEPGGTIQLPSLAVSIEPKTYRAVLEAERKISFEGRKVTMRIG